MSAEADREAWQRYKAALAEYDRTYEDWSDGYWTPPPAPPARWWTHPDHEPVRSVERPVLFNGHTWAPMEGFE